jgi:hypothetical protein
VSNIVIQQQKNEMKTMQTITYRFTEEKTLKKFLLGLNVIRKQLTQSDAQDLNQLIHIELVDNFHQEEEDGIDNVTIENVTSEFVEVTLNEIRNFF